MARWCSLWTVLAVVGGLALATSPGLYKVALTQIGYIQFLKYQVDVPTLRDFTMCLWVRVTNFSNPQPLVSYSKEETERLVRLWLQPEGHSRGHMRLEVLDIQVASIPVDIVLGHWYHFCSSWSNAAGQWMLHVDGKLAGTGRAWQLRGAAIPGGGDVVVGQEYTDFDKGLDDGIEGEVFGFNMMASRRRPHIGRPRGPWLSLGGIRATLRALATDNSIRWPEEFSYRSAVRWPEEAKRRSLTNSNPGLELVERGFNQCAAGRGSPLDRSRLLVAWASTPVRVFGGAVIKAAHPACGAF